jgi:hypothetical protein
MYIEYVKIAEKTINWACEIAETIINNVWEEHEN